MKSFCLTGLMLLTPLVLLAQVPAPAAPAAAPAAPPTQPAIDVSGGMNSNVPRAAPARAGAAVAPISAPSGYQLSSNDSIGVEVFGEDDLKTAARLNSRSEERRVGKEGRYRWSPYH